MVSPKQVCVIGAGVSGLAAAKAFAEHGHKVTIIEKSGNLGGVWDPAAQVAIIDVLFERGALLDHGVHVMLAAEIEATIAW